MENLVVSLETAKKLKAAGFPQTSFWHWTISKPKHSKPSVRLCRPMGDAIYRDDNYSEYAFAPTAQEIADRLSEEFTLKGKPSKNHDHIYYVERPQNIDAELLLVAVKATTMAEALAALWLKLQEASNDL